MNDNNDKTREVIAAILDNNDKTREVIAAMLKENTGRSILDSGDFYGRHWQQNQARDFEQEPSQILSFRWGIDLIHNLFHWLSDRLEYNERVDNLFHEWARRPENEDTTWLGLMYEFVDTLKEPWTNSDHLDKNGKPYINYPIVAGLYGEGEPWTINTGNNSNNLSQEIQFTYFTVEGSDLIDDGIYVILQIHGGCDIRGGYTAPRIFNADTFSEEGIFDYSRGYIWCNNCGAHWYTDDAYNWYADGRWDKQTRLNNYESEELDDVRYESVADDIARAHAHLNEMCANIGSHMKLTLAIRDGNAYCPTCGEDMLQGSD